MRVFTAYEPARQRMNVYVQLKPFDERGQALYQEGSGAVVEVPSGGEPPLYHWFPMDIWDRLKELYTDTESAVELGEKYRDKFTGFEGIAIARFEYLFGCVDVALEGLKRKDDGGAVEAVFDEQRLIAVETEQPVESKAEIGRPHPMPPRR